MLHRATATLCNNGWAAGSPLLLRAAMEVLMASAVIWDAGDRGDYMAFKFMYSFLRETHRDSSNPAALRQDAKEQLVKGIKRLPKALQRDAHNFSFKGKKNIYCVPGPVILA